MSADTLGVFALALVMALGFIGLLLRIRRLTPTKRSPPGVDSKLPVVDSTPRSCEGCRFFSLSGGQTLMQSHAPFLHASQHIPPWQMGRPRAVEPNPEYDALEAEMVAAGKAGEYDRQRELHDKLLAMNPGTLQPPTAVDASLLGLQWEDFGACGVHHELRAKQDACEKWEPKA